MREMVTSLCARVLEGEAITRDQATRLYGAPLEPLCAAADRIRRHFCANRFDLCAIINAKSGACGEDCRFCAQSAHSAAGAARYGLLPDGEILKQAVRCRAQGVPRFSIVTSGRRLSDGEVDALCRAVRRVVEETGLYVCVSVGLLDQDGFSRLKRAGARRAHNNLETSRAFFPSVCTTHSFEDKLSAIRAAQGAGLEVCSGGIMGLGETPRDRVDMAFSLRELGVKSVPLNMLNPIPGTPFAGNRALDIAQMRRIAAVYRFILPDAFIRLAGGRALLPDRGAGCFTSGANAAITGDMLTTGGVAAQLDLALARDLGYETGL